LQVIATLDATKMKGNGTTVIRSRVLLAIIAGILVLLSLAGPALAVEPHGWYPIINAKLTYPQDWSAEVGAYIGKKENGEFSTSVTGPFISVEPGGNGFKINAGYGGGGLSMMIPVGLRASLSYYQAWKDDHGIADGEQFIGIQASAAMMFFTASLGAYYSPDRGSGMVSAGIGIGW